MTDGIRQKSRNSEKGSLSNNTAPFPKLANPVCTLPPCFFKIHSQPMPVLLPSYLQSAYPYCLLLHNLYPEGGIIILCWIFGNICIPGNKTGNTAVISDTLLLYLGVRIPLLDIHWRSVIMRIHNIWKNVVRMNTHHRQLNTWKGKYCPCIKQ